MGCRKIKAKKDLIRIVKLPVDGVIAVDPRGKGDGRGAYICPSIDCINRAMQVGRLSRAFITTSNLTDCINLKNLDKLRQDLLRQVEDHYH